MRVTLGFLIAAAALAGAVWFHSGYKARTITVPVPTKLGEGSMIVHQRAEWQDPLAVFLAVGGVGVGLAIVLPAFRRA